MGSSFRENGGCITSSNTFSIVLYVPDIVFFLNVLRLRHLDKNVLLLFAPSLSIIGGFAI